MGEQAGTGGPFELGRDLVGQVLKDRYTVQSALGSGGMGAVYLAMDEDLQRTVVVKVPHVELLANPTFRARFDREIRSLIGLDHPHVVKVLDVGTHGGLPFAILQYLAGGNLEDRLAARQGRLSPADVASWIRDVSAALDFIHRRGYVHRDVKPGNIMFDETGYAYVGDFGIARVASDTDSGLTQTGFLVGSPRYMPPEAGRGDPPAPAYDQYSLACVVYRAIAGQLPHDADTPLAIMTKKATKPPPDPRALCPELPLAARDALVKGLALEPADRFENCDAFAQAFVAGLGFGVAPRGAHAPPGDASRTALEPTELSRPPSGATVTLADASVPVRTRRTERLALLAVTAALAVALAWQFRGVLSPAPTPAPPEGAPPRDVAEAAPSAPATAVPPQPEAVPPPVDTVENEPAAPPEDPEGIAGDPQVEETAALSTDPAADPDADGEPADAAVDEPVAGTAAGGETESAAPAAPPPVAEEAVADAAPEPTDDVARLLAEASELSKRKRWTTGEPSAVDLYRAVLARDPGNAEATTGLRSIHDHFAAAGARSEAAGDAAAARRHYERALAVVEVPATREALAHAVASPAPSPAPPTGEATTPAPAAAAAAEPPTAVPALSPAGRNRRGHEVFVRSADGARVVRIRGGTFRMGSEGGKPDEQPVHEVIIAPFMLDEHEVTWEQYTRFMRAHGRQRARVPSFGSEPTHPVVNLDFAGAQEYCAWVGGRLPTEAEWELAARGLDALEYPWGREWNASLANFRGTDPFANTAPVGSFPDGESPYGLADMAGNVSEWTADWYDAGAYASAPAMNPKGPAEGRLRVARGGNYNTSDPAELRAAARTPKDPQQYFANYGCRCAMDAP